MADLLQELKQKQGANLLAEAGISQAQDPRILLQDLLIRQARGEQGLESQISQLRSLIGNGGDPAISRSPEGQQRAAIQQSLLAAPMQLADRLEGFGEAAATLGTSAPAELASGLEALPTLATDGAMPAAQRVRQAQDRLTFQPGQEGQEALRQIGQGVQQIASLPGIRQLVESGVSAQDFFTNLTERTGGVIADPFSVAARAEAKEKGLPLPPKSEAQKQGEAAGFAFGEGAPRAVLEGLGLKSTLAKPGDLSKAIAPRKITQSAARSQINPKLIKNVTRQGFDEPVTNVIANASRADKSKLLEILNTFKEGRKNPRFSLFNRPSDTVGDSLLDRFRIVNKANREAGSRIDSVAKSLKGKQVDQSSAVDQFIRDLDDLGVTLDKRLRPNFKGSDIEGSKGAERLIAKIVTRMKNTPNPDAFQSHRLKKFIDEQVSFGGSAEGLTGKTENIVKQLRRNLDQNLDAAFPEYDRVNTVYSETRDAIDALQDAAGRKVNLLGKNADKATGTLLRRLMSNAQSRVNLLDAINEIEDAAIKQGGRFNDDLATQLLFVDELDRVFGPTARTSLQGQGAQTAERVARGESVRSVLFGRALEDAVEKVRGVNEEEAVKALENLLKEGQ